MTPATPPSPPNELWQHWHGHFRPTGTCIPSINSTWLCVRLRLLLLQQWMNECIDGTFGICFLWPDTRLWPFSFSCSAHFTHIFICPLFSLFFCRRHHRKHHPTQQNIIIIACPFLYIQIHSLCRRYALAFRRLLFIFYRSLSTLLIINNITFAFIHAHFTLTHSFTHPSTTQSVNTRICTCRRAWQSAGWRIACLRLFLCVN